MNEKSEDLDQLDLFCWAKSGSKLSVKVISADDTAFVASNELIIKTNKSSQGKVQFLDKSRLK